MALRYVLRRRVYKGDKVFIGAGWKRRPYVGVLFTPVSVSAYTPHQGKREIARRRRQMGLDEIGVTA